MRAAAAVAAVASVIIIQFTRDFNNNSTSETVTDVWGRGGDEWECGGGDEWECDGGEGMSGEGDEWGRGGDEDTGHPPMSAIILSTRL